MYLRVYHDRVNYNLPERIINYPLHNVIIETNPPENRDGQSNNLETIELWPDSICTNSMYHTFLIIDSKSKLIISRINYDYLFIDMIFESKSKT